MVESLYYHPFPASSDATGTYAVREMDSGDAPPRVYCAEFTRLSENSEQVCVQWQLDAAKGEK